MKKLLILFYTVSAFLLLAGCGSREALPPETQAQETELQTEEQTFQTPVAEPAEIPDDWAVTVDIYYVDEETGRIENVEKELNVLDPGLLLDALAEQGMIPEDLLFSSMETVEEEGESALILSMPEEFLDFLHEADIEQEPLIIRSIVNTFIKAYDVEMMKLQVSGDALVTDHNDYEGFLKFEEID